MIKYFLERTSGLLTSTGAASKRTVGPSRSLIVQNWRKIVLPTRDTKDKKKPPGVTETTMAYFKVAFQALSEELWMELLPFGACLLGLLIRYHLQLSGGILKFIDFINAPVVTPRKCKDQTNLTRHITGRLTTATVNRRQRPCQMVNR